MILSSFHTHDSDDRGNNDDNDGVGGAIDFSRCLYRTGHDTAASSYIVRSGATGSRTIVNYNELPEMTVGEFEGVVDGLVGEVGVGDDGQVGGGCWWHFEVSFRTTHNTAHKRRSVSSRWLGGWGRGGGHG